MNDSFTIIAYHCNWLVIGKFGYFKEYCWKQLTAEKSSNGINLF